MILPGDPLIAVHGWLDNAGSFQGVAPNLSRKVIAVDLLGHGLSDQKPDGVVYHYADYVFDIVAMLDELKLERAGLFGHSMGAGISSITAATFPDRISSLFVIEGLGPLVTPSGQNADRLRKHIEQRVTHMGGKKPVRHYTSLEEAIGVRKSGSDISAAACAILAERGVAKDAGGFYWRSDRRLMIQSAHGFAKEQVANFIESISVPTCVVAAKEGILESLIHIRSRAKQVKGAKFLEIAGNHHVHMDQPEEIARIANDFYGNL